MDNLLIGTFDVDNKSISGSLIQQEDILSGFIDLSSSSVVGNLGDSFIRGHSIAYKWNGTKLGIKSENQDKYCYVDLKGYTGTGIINAKIKEDNLILILDDGTEINTGNVRGAKGDSLFYDDSSIRNEIKQLSSTVFTEYIKKSDIGDFSMEKHEYDTYNLFPAIPKNKDIQDLFIDRESKETYRWDDIEMKYYKIGSNYENINIISGGSAI